jgi:hypothetical protein
MSHPIFPWCLHWDRDGELVQSDRHEQHSDHKVRHKRAGVPAGDV